MEGLNADGTRDGENRRCPNAGSTCDVQGWTNAD